ncbi:MAG: hypothetical protein PHS52_06725 [Desulfotomaculaceae bacterium]|nr:hypothetical protein [Desulfotomaculaceae bacterium]
MNVGFLQAVVAAGKDMLKIFKTMLAKVFFQLHDLDVKMGERNISGDGCAAHLL